MRSMKLVIPVCCMLQEAIGHVTCCRSWGTIDGGRGAGLGLGGEVKAVFSQPISWQKRYDC